MVADLVTDWRNWSDHGVSRRHEKRPNAIVRSRARCRPGGRLLPPEKNASGLYSFSLAQNGGSGLGSVEVLRYKSEITKPRQGGKKKVEQTLSTVSCS